MGLSSTSSPKCTWLPLSFLRGFSYWLDHLTIETTMADRQIRFQTEAILPKMRQEGERWEDARPRVYIYIYMKMVWQLSRFGERLFTKHLILLEF